jgi:DNA processing protein
MLSRLLRDTEADTASSPFEVIAQLVANSPKYRHRLIDLSKEDFRRCYEKADETLEKASDQDINVISMRDDPYPHRLLMLPFPPPIIYIKGNISSLHSAASIAIVGTRTPTNFGERCALRLGAVFGGAKATVVSGLAIGCDTAAHYGCITAEGQTSAILAHGLDRIYPKQNESLAEEILSKGGCLLSEYAPGARPFRSHFIERDKLQVALSDGVVVVETDIVGGTMHTVRFSLEQQKPLACLKHPAKYRDVPQTQGNQLLLGRGQASPIFDQTSLNSFWEGIRKRSSRNASRLPSDIAQLCFENGI